MGFIYLNELDTRKSIDDVLMKSEKFNGIIIGTGKMRYWKQESYNNIINKEGIFIGIKTNEGEQPYFIVLDIGYKYLLKEIGTTHINGNKVMCYYIKNNIVDKQLLSAISIEYNH